MLDRRTLLLGATALPLAAPALAQGTSDWPNRPVRVVIPWPPGGSTDVLARIVSEQLSVKLGQPFVLENRPGASGNIGMEAIAKAAPSGRLGEVGDIAPVVGFLASPAAQWVNGQNVRVNGVGVTYSFCVSPTQ